ncbi:substrate-binding domain-containing protein [Actinocrispum wychmicini]|uniref:ABC-type phosphate transport system substrate-binding protein n=1 Tax=Actinocrispum wychmicini TaxID=1213861 RepID=A0A4R2K7U1_9PSEU|nr:substrate-binding domain-containing protein [Actinocrispum wychmicini]TCO62425.1 ABC-type phosphate transport system substrate-binding protein [Actinocrispum wychmicini]
MKKLQRVVVALAATAMMGGAAGVAQADPTGDPTYRDIVGVGSDTTQSVMNGLADAITVNGVKVLGSYDAVGASPIITKDPAALPACSLTRPANSGEGVNALVAAQDGSTNCVQFARSSSNNSANYPGKNLTYVPFAVDAVTYVVRSDSTISKKLTTAQLKSIYNCTAPGVGTTYKPLLPKFGSGTRNFFLQSLGLTNSATYTTQFPCVADKDGTGADIEENTGTFLTLPQHLAPYSIAVYQSQVNGVAPSVQGKAVLSTLNGISPTSLNTSSSFKRDVYNVVPTGKLGTAPYNTVFVGGNSQICLNSDLIKKYGFGTATNCGDTVIVTP